MTELELVELGDILRDTNGSPWTPVINSAPDDLYPNVFLPYV